MSEWARTETGDMLLPTLGSGDEAIVTDPVLCAQIKIESVLQFVLAEWPFDLSKGVPWPQIWGQKNPQLTLIDGILRRAILAIQVGVPPAPLVASVTDLSLNYDPTKRDLRYGYEVILATGETVTGPTS